MTEKSKRIASVMALIAVTAVWGWTFVLVKDAVSLYPSMPFLALRFLMAALVLAPLAALRRPAATQAAPGLQRLLGWKSSLKGGVVMGLFLGAGYIFQTIGLERTTSSNAGFITGMFVVLTPLMQAALWRRFPSSRAIVGVVLATAGLFLLSGGATHLEPLGDGLVFLCAVSFAAHILATGRYVANRDPLRLTLIQIATVGVMTSLLSVVLAVARISPPLALPSQGQVWLALLVTAVLASAAGFLVQTSAQRHAAPTETALILTFEPVFAGLFGFLLAGDRWGWAGWIGAGLILAGMLWSEFGPKRGAWSSGTADQAASSESTPTPPPADEA